MERAAKNVADADAAARSTEANRKFNPRTTTVVELGAFHFGARARAEPSRPDPTRPDPTTTCDDQTRPVTGKTGLDWTILALHQTLDWILD